MFRRRLGERHFRLGESWHALAAMREMRGEYARALELARQSAEVRTGPFRTDPEIVAARMLRALGRFTEALQMQQRIVEQREKGSGTNPEHIAAARFEVATTLNESGRHAEALTLMRRVREELISGGSKESIILAEAHESHGRWLLRAGRLSEALSELEKAVALMEKIQNADHRSVGAPLVSLAEAQIAVKKHAAARKNLERALRIIEGSRPAAELLARARFALAQVFVAEGQSTASRDLAQRALADLQRSEHHERLQMGSRIQAWLSN